MGAVAASLLTSAAFAQDADLAVSATDSPDPVTAGSNITFSAFLTNAGPSTATNVQLQTALPPGTTFVSLTSEAGFTCTTPSVGANGTVTCSNPGLGAVGMALFTLVTQVGAGVANGTMIETTFTASATSPDPNNGNNVNTQTTAVFAPPPPPPPPIPTLSEWAMMFMATALAGLAALTVSRRRGRAGG
jgi:uncharacterized repeat protein (TIGR01451 family)